MNVFARTFCAKTNLNAHNLKTVKPWVFFELIMMNVYCKNVLLLSLLCYKEILRSIFDFELFSKTSSVFFPVYHYR